MIQNRYVMTKENYLEFQYAHGKISLHWMLFTMCIILGLPVLVRMMIEGVLLPGCLGLLLVFCIIKLAINRGYQNGYQQFLMQNGKAAPELVVSLDAQIRIESLNNGGTQIYEFSDIHKILETDNLFIIIIKPRLAITLPNDGFFEGDAAEFREVILRNCPQVKKIKAVRVPRRILRRKPE